MCNRSISNRYFIISSIQIVFFISFASHSGIGNAIGTINNDELSLQEQLQGSQHSQTQNQTQQQQSTLSILTEWWGGDTSPSGSSSINHWRERIQAAWNAVTITSETNKKQQQQPPVSAAELGHNLLSMGDAAGAEAVCTSAAKLNENDVDALVCLGEARLALFDGAWRSFASSPNSEDYDDADTVNESQSHLQRTMILKRINQAKENFESAVLLDPTNPQARCGLGLALFLLATRRIDTSIKSNPNVEISNSLLFDAILHLNAAATLTSPKLLSMSQSQQQKQKQQQLYGQKRKEEIHIAALYNSALAHLALGDSTSAVPLLRDVSKIIKEQMHADDEGVETEEVKGMKGRVISIPELNLGGALLQSRISGGSVSNTGVGASRDVVSMTNSTINKFCQVHDKESHSNYNADDDDDDYDFGDRYDNENVISDRVKRSKLCAIAWNNLGVAEEYLDKRHLEDVCLNDGDDEIITSKYYSTSDEFGRILGLGKASFASTNGEAEISMVKNALKLNLPDCQNKLEKRDDEGFEVDNNAGGKEIEEKINKGTASAQQDGITSLGGEDIKDETSTESYSSKISNDADRENVVDDSKKDEKDQKDDRSRSQLMGPIQIAIEALEKATLQDPNQARLWISLSRMKLRAGGDKAGAVQAAARALSVANGSKEMDSATGALEEALGYDEFPSSVSSSGSEEKRSAEDDHMMREIEKKNYRATLSTSNSPIMPIMSKSGENGDVTESPAQSSEVKTLMLEKEILTLKLQLMQQGLERPLTRGWKMNEEQGDGGNDAVDDYERRKVTDQVTRLQDASSIPITDNIDENERDSKQDDTISKVDREIDEADKDELELIDEGSTNAATELESILDSTSIEHGDETKLVTKKAAQDSSERKSDADVKNDETIDVVLPELFNPPKSEAEELSAISKSYMKVADAYFEKKSYSLASKQFLKVLKKAPNHIPAILGYATSLELSAKPKQVREVVNAYKNVTQVAAAQDDKKLARATLIRAVEVSKKVTDDRMKILRSLVNYAHSDALAAEIYYQIGMEFIGMSDDIKPGNVEIEEAAYAFRVANALEIRENNNATSFHAKSSLQLGKLALAEDSDSGAEQALKLIQMALSEDLGDLGVEALVFSGHARKRSGDVDGATQAYRKAIEMPKTEFTGLAHYHLGLILHLNKKSDLDDSEIKSHIELALNLGMDPTPEAIEILGEHHIAIMKSTNRAQWKEYKKNIDSQETIRGGIMSGSSTVSSQSIFSPKPEESSETSETLSLLEQGAATYDGKTIPTGEEI